MSDHDQLRDRLRAVDPCSPESPLGPTDPAAQRAHLEQIMATHSNPVHRRSRRTTAVAAAAVAAAGVGVGAVLVGSRTDGSGGEVVELTSVDTGTSMGSCISPSPELLASVPLAFAGTTTEVTDDRVTFEVERWYAGGDGAERAVVDVTTGINSLAGQIDFRTGDRFLISAANGALNLCGFSGPATEDLEALYEQAFDS